MRAHATQGFKLHLPAILMKKIALQL